MPKIYEEYKFTGSNEERLVAKVRPEVLKMRFLELYMQTAHIHKTCEILGMAPRNVYRWKVDDPEFDENMKMAEQVALMVLEDEATRRAQAGQDTSRQSGDVAHAAANRAVQAAGGGIERQHHGGYFGMDDGSRLEEIEYRLR